MRRSSDEARTALQTPTDASFKLDRRPTADMVAAHLRDRLMVGDYYPEQPMRESLLAEELGVSRPTMREALQHLVREGLLTYHMHRGMVVAALGEDDIEDLYKVRSILEATGISFLGKQQVSLQAAQDAVARFVVAVESRDELGILDADMDFHSSLVALAESKRLVQYHAAIWRQLRLALGRMDTAHGDLDSQVREHQRLLKDLERNRLDAAKTHLQAHLDRARGRLIRFVREDRSPSS